MFDASELDSIGWIAIVVPLFLLFTASFVDLFRRKDLSVIRKVLWVAVILLTAYIGVALYFLLRPPRTPEGKHDSATETRTKGIVDQLQDLKGAHEQGDIDDEAFLEGKRMILGISIEPLANS